VVLYGSLTVFDQLKPHVESFHCFGLSMDESKDISDTAQFIFTRGSDSAFQPIPVTVGSKV
jgi:hypothetical protein